MKQTTAPMILLACIIGQTHCASAAPETGQAATASAAITNMFGKDLINAQQQKVPVDALAGKKLGIYFSAHWCPPCRAFTPMLVSFYNAVLKEGKSFEIVFVSSDRTEKDMHIYMKKMAMPWLAVPFDSVNKAELARKFGVRSIPTLVIVNARGDTLSSDGRGDVTRLGTKAFDKW